MMNALYLLTLLWGLASAQVLERVGDVFPVRFRSNGVSDIKGTDTPLGKSYVLTHPGATYIALHFAKLDLMKGDTIEVSDANGGQAYTLTGSGKGKGSPFWSQHVKGDTIVLNTRTKSRGRSSLFVVGEYAAGFEATPEAICGIDDKANAVCYASSFPNEYSKSRPVARLLINGSNMCTGFLVSGSNHLLTSNHCIKTAADALNTDYEFMGEAPTCGSPSSQLSHRGTIFSAVTFIKTSTSLDYTLVQINSGNPASLYGFLELEDQPAVTGGRIYIPQHPGGKAKQLAIFSTHTGDASDGFCRINNIGKFGCGGSSSTNLFYFCDTEGGSSGSPVIATSTNKVVGLHKCGGCANGNHGTSAHLIWNEVGSTILPQQAPTPFATPTAPTPVATPTAPTPVATPTAPTTVAVPTAPTPVAAPTVPTPVAAPTVPTPVATPTAPTPIATPTVPTPVATPTAPTPVATPTAPSPVAAPSAPSPVAAPSATTPVATPTAPVQAPVQPLPPCLASRSRCSSGTRCCSGVCGPNRRCR